MPLTPGHDRATISRNIREMISSGHPQAQAVAAALSSARRYADGGAPQVPVYAAAPKAQFTSVGLIPNVGGGSYQLDPNTGGLTADTLSGLQALAQRGLKIGATTPPPDPAPDAAPPPDLSGLFQNWGGGGLESGGGGDGGGGGGGGNQSRGGRLATGGVPSSAQMAPWFVHREASMMDHPTGLVASATPGRKDVVPLSVASGSYVVPADVVSGISEGNTLAGARHLEAAMHSGPGGMPLAHLHTRSLMPHPPSVSHLAQGGLADGAMPRMVHPHEWAGRHVPDGIPVLVAGGEFIYGPRDVEHIGDGDMDRGHDKLDQFVLAARARNVRATAKLPGPKHGNEK